jgi:site-specific DNA-methyltransferase (adenine-specific)
MSEGKKEILLGDCLELMKDIPDKSIDMILADLPYGTTEAKWDCIIPMDALWNEYKRIIVDGGAIVLTAREPFTSKLVISNLKGYKHKWIWNKKQSGSFANAKFMPLQIEEDILVFTKNGEKVNYYPQMRKGKMRKKGGSKKQIETMSKFIQPEFFKYSDDYYPVNILEDYPNCSNKANNMHPTQKPVELFEYLIKTYTNEGDLVLDNCAGSGTTAIACLKTNRQFIVMEKEQKYYDIILKRVADFSKQQTLFKNEV